MSIYHSVLIDSCQLRDIQVKNVTYIRNVREIIDRTEYKRFHEKMCKILTYTLYKTYRKFEKKQAVS